MKWFENTLHWFKKKEDTPTPLRIQGVSPVPMTPEPDDAELAAQALLEMMVSASDKSHDDKMASSRNSEKKADSRATIRDAAYYHQLASRIRLANEEARLRLMRFLSFAEQELQKKDLPMTGEGSLGMLEAELYKRIDTVERVGGELKNRWQHCLAEVTVRMMQTPHTGDTPNP